MLTYVSFSDIKVICVSRDLLKLHGYFQHFFVVFFSFSYALQFTDCVAEQLKYYTLISLSDFLKMRLCKGEKMKKFKSRLLSFTIALAMIVPMFVLPSMAEDTAPQLITSPDG